MAFAGTVIVEAAGAGIHRGREHKARGKSQRHGGACDANGAIFERLAHDIENIARKFREFIEEENSVMSERNLAGAGNCSAADETRVGNRVMGSAEWAEADQSGVCIEHSSNTVNLGSFESLLKSEGWQDGWHALGEHRLAGARRADHQDVVTSGAGNFK